MEINSTKLFFFDKFVLYCDHIKTFAPMNNPIYIAQALRDCWSKEESIRELNHPRSPKTPLLYYIEYQYKERYVALCVRCGIEPLSIGKWLFKPVSSLH